MFSNYPNYSMFNNYRAPNYYDGYTPQNNYYDPLKAQANYNVPRQEQAFNMNAQPPANQNNVPSDMIKGKYINSLNDVIELSSSSYEPFVCVDFNSQKVYIKTFNIDGSYTIEEFLKNPNAKIDTRNQTEKLADTVNVLASEVVELKKQLNNINIGGTYNEQPTSTGAKQSKSKLS